MLAIWLFLALAIITAIVIIGAVSYGLSFYLFRIWNFLPLAASCLLIFGFKHQESVKYVLEIYPWQLLLFAFIGGYFLNGSTPGRSLTKFLLASVSFIFAVILSMSLGYFLTNPSPNIPRSDPAVDTNIFLLALSPLITAVFMWWKHKRRVSATDAESNLE